MRAKVCCTPPSNGAQTEIEWTATRVDAAFHMDRHRGSTPLGSIYTLACARWAELYGHLRALIPISRALVSRAPSCPDSDFTGASFTLACARWTGFTLACAPDEILNAPKRD